MTQEKKLPIRAVITGGHQDPAIAVLQELEKEGRFEFHWVGQKNEGGQDGPSLEFRTVRKLGIPFYDLKTGKLYKSSILEWVKIPFGFFHALYLLFRIRPRVVISFGGYIAAPVVLAAYTLGIPSVTHEQTVVLGWANRFISLFAKKIFVSWEESLKHFPKGKTVLTGNPVRRAVFEKKVRRFEFKNDLPTVYVTGGKRGAHVINETIRGALSTFLERFNIIHQTGASEVFQDYQKLQLLKTQLPKKLRSHYIVQEFFGLDEIGAVFAACDLIVGRAGANTVTELAALAKPAVLIPIPWASHNEQYLNAKLLSARGAVLILPESELSTTNFLEAVSTIVSDLGRFRKSARSAKGLVKPDAASLIARGIRELVDLS
ncbi:hypothetical protein GTO10_05420 [Candidatus Saccharibacteria bacterium]|nr:hypothetical protein [Candidatus Saccharibacteria bacterium]